MHLGVIAAGDGIRLKEEGIIEPKPLVKVFGKSLLERILSLSEKYGFESCNMIINGKFREEIENSRIIEKFKKIKLNYIFKSTPSSLHSLYELKPLLEKDSFCLMTIDSIYREQEFADFIKQAGLEKNIDGLIAVTSFVDDEKPLWVKVDENNKILEFSSLQNNCELVTGGIYFFNRGVIEYTENAIRENKCRLRNFLQYVIEKGKNLKAFEFSKIIDIDHRKDIIEAEKFLKQNGITS